VHGRLASTSDSVVTRRNYGAFVVFLTDYQCSKAIMPVSRPPVVAAMGHSNWT
jgi:hypothetical protein